MDEGRRQISRGAWPLPSTGMLGGIDVGTGVLVLLVEHETGSILLGGLPSRSG